MTSRNDTLFAAAQQVTPGGVNSPVRAFRSVGGTPRFFARGSGARFWDADEKAYIDYVGSWGPLILGHAHPAVVHAVQAAAANGNQILKLSCRLSPSDESSAFAVPLLPNPILLPNPTTPRNRSAPDLWSAVIHHRFSPAARPRQPPPQADRRKAARAPCAAWSRRTPNTERGISVHLVRANG